jgi:Ca2+-binding RTX toxin-like protein
VRGVGIRRRAVVVGSATIALGAFGLASEAAQAGSSCYGPDEVPAAIVGTDGPDHLGGTAGGDLILGGDGDDRIETRSASDIVCAGRGDDRIVVGEGLDYVDAGRGDDVIKLGAGVDCSCFALFGPEFLVFFGGGYGGPGDDHIFPGRGGGTVDAGSGDDFVRGVIAFNSIQGGPGEDLLIGGIHQDGISGGLADDRLYARGGPDGGGTEEDPLPLEGGAGHDRIYGGNGNDDFVDCGETGSDRFYGGAGKDAFCRFESGKDHRSRDVFDGRGGVDRITYAAGGDRATSLAVSLDDVRDDGPRCPGCALDDVRDFEDVLVTSRVRTRIVGNAERNRIRVFGGGDSIVTGGQRADRLRTDEGDDLVAGGGGNDRIRTAESDDTIDGGRHHDRCRGGSGADTALHCEDVQGVP